MSELTLFEAIASQRAIRRFTSQPVPDEAITRILEAATRAPSGRNRQPWRFLIIRDPKTRAAIGEYYRRACEAAGIGRARIPGLSQQVNESVVYLAENIGKAPVLILPCVEFGSVARAGSGGLTQGSNIYPAVQNLMLAARALGLGTTITTVHTKFENEIKTLLGIPDNVQTAALIPLGYPAGGDHFGGSRRKPVSEVAHYDRWNQAWPG